jgi:hypothetical protein
MASKKVVVRSWDEALDVLDGKKLVLDGVDGVLRVRRRRDQYGPVLTGVLMHVPSAKGKQSAKYLETKRQLRDDWDTDLTGSERAADIAAKFVVMVDDDPVRMTRGEWEYKLQTRLDSIYGGSLAADLMKQYAALIHTSYGVRRQVSAVVRDIQSYERGA